MKLRGRPILLTGLIVGLEAGGLACGTLPEEVRIDMADAVIEGVANCDIDRGRCRLRAREVIKEDGSRRGLSPLYALRFDPGANERLMDEMLKKGELWMCSWIWEPRSTRIEGRFYLDRDGSRYRVRSDSPSGSSETEESEE